MHAGLIRNASILKDRKQVKVVYHQAVRYVSSLASSLARLWHGSAAHPAKSLMGHLLTYDKPVPHQTHYLWDLYVLCMHCTEV